MEPNPTHRKEPNMPRRAAVTGKQAVQARKDRQADKKAASLYQGRTPADKPGLRGKALQTYLETGMGSKQQLEAARLSLEMNTHQPANTKEATMARTATSTRKAASARTRKDQQEQPQTKRTAKRATGQLTAAQVARGAGLDPRKFRAFLRGEGIDRTFGTKGAVNKALKAFAKATV